MRIVIPEEYRGHFPTETMWLNLKDEKHCASKEYTKVFISRWRNREILLLNEAERDRLTDTLELSIQEDNKGLVRFINAGIHTALMSSGSIEIPEHLSSWLEGDRRSFSKGEMGILVQ